MNPKRPTPRYIIIKMAKFIVKERITDVEKKPMVTRGERGGRDKWGDWD